MWSHISFSLHKEKAGGRLLPKNVKEFNKKDIYFNLIII